MRSRPALLLKLLLISVTFALSGQDPLPELTVNLDARNRPLNQVLDELSLQTGYYFTYNADLFREREKVKLELNRVSLGVALDSLFTDPAIAYRVVDRNIVIYKVNPEPPGPMIPGVDRRMLNGKVVDSRTGKALSYATIALYGTSLGSVSNQEGEFAFKLPTEMNDPLLAISFLGYKDLLYPVTASSVKPLVIGLERETIPLQEVIIRYAEPVKLLQRALKKIPENYLQEHASMKAYYRESVKRNDHFMVYSEAILDVSKGPYSPATSGDQVRILKGRKITNTSAEDTILIKLRSGIYASMNLDIIKNPPDFLSDNFQELYDLEFSDVMTYGDRQVYLLTFKQKSHIRELMFQGSLYIDTEHLTILAADFEFNPDLIHKEPGLFLVSGTPGIRIRPLSANYHVEYRDHMEGHHVNQVRADVVMKVRRQRKWIPSRYQIALEMAVTEVTPGERMRFSRSERVKPTTILADRRFEYDPAFWGPYNTIKPEATLLESLNTIQEQLLEINESE